MGYDKDEMLRGKVRQLKQADGEGGTMIKLTTGGELTRAQSSLADAADFIRNSLRLAKPENLSKADRTKLKGIAHQAENAWAICCAIRHHGLKRTPSKTV